MKIEDMAVPGHIAEEWAQSIERGMKFLDDYFERDDWVNEIDLEDLDLNNGSQCVCGQLFESHAEAERQKGTLDPYDSGYEWALQYVVEHEPHETDPENIRVKEGKWAQEHGFYAPLLDDFNLDEVGFVDPEGALLDFNDVCYDDIEGSANPYWDLFTYRWKAALERRRAELAER